MRWFASYLPGRTQATKIGDICSSALPITSGVIQGSLQPSSAVAQTPIRAVIHSNWLVPGLYSHGPSMKGKLSVSLHLHDSLCQSPSHHGTTYPFSDP
ncbi:hypothetical protein T265_04958 [Opisthorchis viverrini]|uniref:Uncharacterized protein n=1 Tax=Opisthorchis viverrini TaxID=6198 RepID=A0A075AFV8_OPIVI|nr:hypothetical protein T265_04958 [Opisthorchis viverrini]KER28119.1 hypothetical protein T265_04958 [Opisthorchis viverrini]